MCFKFLKACYQQKYHTAWSCFFFCSHLAMWHSNRVAGVCATTSLAVSSSVWGGEHTLVGSPGWVISKWLLDVFVCGERRSWAQGSCDPLHIFVRDPGVVWLWLGSCSALKYSDHLLRVACGILTGRKLCLFDKMSFCHLLPASLVYRSATMVWYLLVSSIHSILLLFVWVFWRRGFWIFCKTMEMWLWKHLKTLMTSLQMIRFQINNVLNKKNVLSWIMNKVKCITPSALGNWRQTGVLLYKALEVHNFVNQNHYIFKSFICLKAVWTAK